MIDRAFAEDFARQWAANWNARDLDAILAHYAPDVVFRSPRIAVVLGRNQTSVRGIDALRDYWNKALAAAGEIRFVVDDVYVGGDALSILYRNQRGERVSETLVFGPDGRIVEGIVTSLVPRIA
jgi:ketosteroid isomerase-like protein